MLMNFRSLTNSRVFNMINGSLVFFVIDLPMWGSPNGVSGRYIAMFLDSFLTFLDQQVVDNELEKSMFT